VSIQLRLFALFDDEALRRPLPPIEQAELYAEYEQSVVGATINDSIRVDARTVSRTKQLSQVSSDRL